MSQRFSGSVRMMRAHVGFLGAMDLAGAGDVDIRVVQVNHYRPGEKLAGKSLREDKYSLVHEIRDGDGWMAAPKEWILNRTNETVLWYRHGANVDGWEGKVLTLYITPVKAIRGGQTMGVRIRSTAEERDPKQMRRLMLAAAGQPEDEPEVVPDETPKPSEGDE